MNDKDEQAKTIAGFPVVIDDLVPENTVLVGERADIFNCPRLVGRATVEKIVLALREGREPDVHPMFAATVERIRKLMEPPTFCKPGSGVEVQMAQDAKRKMLKHPAMMGQVYAARGVERHRNPQLDQIPRQQEPVRVVILGGGGYGIGRSRIGLIAAMIAAMPSPVLLASREQEEQEQREALNPDMEDFLANERYRTERVVRPRSLLGLSMGLFGSMFDGRDCIDYTFEHGLDYGVVSEVAEPWATKKGKKGRSIPNRGSGPSASVSDRMLGLLDRAKK